MKMNELEAILEQLQVIQAKFDIISDIVKSMRTINAGEVPSGGEESLIRLAASVIESREDIGGIFDPIIFADPATNIMLHLYLDKAKGSKSTSGTCCTVAKVPRTTALRLLNLLSERDLVDMYIMKSDRRLTAVQLTDAGFHKIHLWLTNLYKSLNPM